MSNDNAGDGDAKSTVAAATVLGPDARVSEDHGLTLTEQVYEAVIATRKAFPSQTRAAPFGHRVIAQIRASFARL
jgi:hypothetical protein